MGGGNTWHPQVDNLIALLNALHFRAGYGWAVWELGFFLRTEACSTWIDQNSGKAHPNSFSLPQNHPNPFNPLTNITFHLPYSEFVELKVYNILGKEVATIVTNKLNQGNHTYTFDEKNLADGIYYYRIHAGDFQDVKKMVLIK